MECGRRQFCRLGGIGFLSGAAADRCATECDVDSHCGEGCFHGPRGNDGRDVAAGAGSADAGRFSGAGSGETELGVCLIHPVIHLRSLIWCSRLSIVATQASREFSDWWPTKKTIELRSTDSRGRLSHMSFSLAETLYRHS